MALAPGARLGPYEIVAAIGAGGMGEVYRARDTQLKRDVALKVLPSDFAPDADRLARFDREAQALAALNHPHIAQVYGVVLDAPSTPRQGSEQTGSGQGGVRAIVMEMVEGPALAERITGGAVVRLEPSFDALPADVPARVRRVLQLCLRNDLRQRAQAMGDVRLALEGAFEVAVPQAATAAPSPSRSTRLAWIAALAVAAGVVVALAVPAMRHLREAPPSSPRCRPRRAGWWPTGRAGPAGGNWPGSTGPARRSARWARRMRMVFHSPACRPMATGRWCPARSRVTPTSGCWTAPARAGSRSM